MLEHCSPARTVESIVLAACTGPPRMSGDIASSVEPDVCAPIDANGNLTADGSRTFGWDAIDQLAEVVTGAQRSEFSYDFTRRRVRVVEKQSDEIQSDSRAVWVSDGSSEERDSSGCGVSTRGNRG